MNCTFFEDPTIAFDSYINILVRHYGLYHKIALKYLNERVGILNCSESFILERYKLQVEPGKFCKICYEEFEETDILNRHYRSKHFENCIVKLCNEFHEKNRPFECSACKFQVKNLKELAIHVLLNHKSVNSLFENFHEKTLRDDPNEKSGNVESDTMDIIECPFEFETKSVKPEVEEEIEVINVDDDTDESAKLSSDSCENVFETLDWISKN